MTSYRAARERPLIARDSARRLGSVESLIVDPDAATIVAIGVQRGRERLLVSWGDLVAFGADAVIIPDERAVRQPANDQEQRALRDASGTLDQLVLSDRGNACGSVTDIEFDATSGRLEALRIGSDQVEPDRLLGIGSYAVVVESRDGAAVTGL